jgi:ATP-dependent Lhr-like helicase
MFSPATQTWFDEAFPAPTPVQRQGWAAIGTGAHALLVAPTGSGKTLAAFLAAIDSLATRDPAEPDGTRVLYVSPLKALVYDVERNLRAPLAGIRRTAERLDRELPPVRVAVRTGDTPGRERQRQAKEPGEILVTTPESLFLILGSRARETLRSVHTVIVDEVHAVAPSKRGAHLALSLERLCEITRRDPQRIGLSATVRPLDAVARFLGGDRPVEIVDASARPDLDLLVTVPVPDMTDVPDPRPSADEGGPILGYQYDREISRPSQQRGLWAVVYPELLEQIRAGRSTIIFTNSRGTCERTAQRLNELAGEELVRAHHGSVSHEKRAEIEEGLKCGTLRGIVATSSLELGIDMGAVDRVILVESPGSVARGLQRVGRAGHGVGETSIGRVYPKHRGDLLECAVLAARMQEGALEALHVPRNPLDVLAQQIVAMCCDRERGLDEIEAIVRRADAFRELGRAGLEAVCDLLSGRYPSSEFADLRPLLSWDRARDRLSPRRGADIVSRLNAGTIPDRGSYGLHLGPDGPRLGELDEEMVHETKTGDNILLGATTWRVEEITRDRVVVSPAPGEPGRLPFWKGEGPRRPVEVGRAIGAFLRELAAVRRDRAEEWIRKRSPLDELAARNLADYVAEQKAHSGAVPTDRTVCIERFRDELGDWRVCILSPFGAKVHAPWAMALQRALSARSGFELQMMWSEDGIVLRFADTEELPPTDALLPDPEEAEELVTEQLGDTALFAGLFRENVVRSLLLPRRRPGGRNPLWAQRLKSQELLGAVRRYPSFPMSLETYREALRDVFDVPALVDVLRGIRSRDIAVHEVGTASASPFARSLVFAYVAAYMYEGDAPLAERRAQALTVDRALLRELLGQAELRELIDPGALAELEELLQRRAEGRRVRDADETHDLLRALGDLTEAEIHDRSEGDPAPRLARLEEERRAAPVNLAGERRWIATDDAGLYRDALGAVPPPGLPSAFLEEVERPLERLVARFARHRGPFPAREAAARWRLRASQLEPALRALETEGRLVHGEIRPGGSELDWCDAEVLRRLKRMTLARLRKEVAPVDGRTLGRFLPRWHGVGEDGAGPDRLLEAIARLEGAALPWSEWCESVLPARAGRFRAEDLDLLSASGEVVWIGRGALGPRDGRVAIYLRDHVAELADAPEDEGPDGGLPAAVLGALEQRGASFLSEIERSVKAEQAPVSAEELRQALWDLAWSGHVTNDTFGALRELAAPARTRRRGFRRRGPAATGGRWFLVRSALTPAPSDTARAVARARVLLERYGIVSREAAHAEGYAGGFASVYRVLREMEENGGIRRGWFVDGIGGAQFAHPAAVDRLRAERPEDAADREWTEEDAVVLSALDPANPYGALLPWPEAHGESDARARRVAGARVVLVDGWPVLWLGPRGRQLVVFPPPDREAGEALRVAVPALRRAPGASRRRLRIEKIDGRPAAETPYLETLRGLGFVTSYRGLADTAV